MSRLGAAIDAPLWIGRGAHDLRAVIPTSIIGFNQLAVNRYPTPSGAEHPIALSSEVASKGSAAVDELDLAEAQQAGYQLADVA